MEIEALTLHRDGTIGLMYRCDGELGCTCGWPGNRLAMTGTDGLVPDPGFYAPRIADDSEDEDGPKLWSMWEIAEREGRLIRSEKPEEGA